MSVLLFASLVLLLVALTCNWWQGSLSFFVFGSAQGFFDLWTFRTEGNILGFRLPSIEYSLDSEDMCGSSLQELAVGHTFCSNLIVIRVLIFVALFAALFAEMCSIVCLFLHRGYCVRPIEEQQETSFLHTMPVVALACLSAVWSGASWICSAIAVGFAASMPYAEDAQKIGILGAGAYSAVVQMFLCFIAMLFQMSIVSCTDVSKLSLQIISCWKRREPDEQANSAREVKVNEENKLESV